MNPSDHPARGILIMMAAQAIFGVTDALQKLLMETVPLMIVVWSRFAIFLVILGPLVVLRPAHLAPSPERRLLILRGCAFLGATCFMAGALARLPLATATTLMFVGPFIVTAMSALLLKEQVGWRRWSAIGVGFAGMLIVVRPGGADSVGWPALLVLGSTVCWSLGIIATRRVGGRADAITMVVWQALTGFVLSAPFAYLTWKTPDMRDAGLLLLNGSLNLFGQWLTVRALQLAPVSAVAPLTYTVIVWATILGWSMFGALPDAWTLAGAAVIIASGLYVWWRERQRAATRNAAAPDARTTGNP
ncbi:MAG: DMT family transporter [Alphaproteobacteria bacterium]|nr:DMT family transporter [Alphaproteobacteria bacterium]